MFETGASPESDRAQKAAQWISDVGLILGGMTSESDIPAEYARFILRLERGLQISEQRIELMATLQDRRETFCEENGADPIIEQFIALKLAIGP